VTVVGARSNEPTVLSHISFAVTVMELTGGALRGRVPPDERASGPRHPADDADVRLRASPENLRAS